MVTTDKVTVTEFAPHIGKTTTDYKENDMGVKEAIETLDRFCASQDYWCGNCPIAKDADQSWFDWGCPIAQVIDDTTIREAIAEMED